MQTLLFCLVIPRNTRGLFNYPRNGKIQSHANPADWVRLNMLQVVTVLSVVFILHDGASAGSEEKPRHKDEVEWLRLTGDGRKEQTDGTWHDVVAWCGDMGLRRVPATPTGPPPELCSGHMFRSLCLMACFCHHSQTSHESHFTHGWPLIKSKPPPHPPDLWYVPVIKVLILIKSIN